MTVHGSKSGTAHEVSNNSTVRYAFSETLSNSDALISKFAVSGSSVADCAYQDVTHCTVLSIDNITKSDIDIFIRDYIIIKRK